jgi:homoserine kinase type II
MVSLGKNISKIHNVGIQSKLQRKNDMLALSSWDYILEKFKHYDGKSKSEITHVTNTIKYLSDKFPRSLRTSLIHGDLFRDNIFFQNNEVSGFIDFFFTCSDTIVYDLATLINAWFYDGGQFDEYHFKIFFNQYFDSISWSDDEKNYLNFYLKVSAIRFFLTRIHDQYFNKKGEVKHKDPLEFFDILNFHEKRNLQDFF